MTGPRGRAPAAPWHCSSRGCYGMRRRWFRFAARQVQKSRTSSPNYAPWSGHSRIDPGARSSMRSLRTSASPGILPHGRPHRRVQWHNALDDLQIAGRAERLHPQRFQPQAGRAKPRSQRRNGRVHGLRTWRHALAWHLRHRDLRVAREQPLDGILIRDREIVHVLLHLCNEPAACSCTSHVEQPGTHPVCCLTLVHRVRARAPVVVVVAARPRIRGDDQVLATSCHVPQEIWAQNEDVDVRDDDVDTMSNDELHESQLHPQKLEVARV